VLQGLPLVDGAKTKLETNLIFPKKGSVFAVLYFDTIFVRD